jgi:hypothetical protein
MIVGLNEYWVIEDAISHKVKKNTGKSREGDCPITTISQKVRSFNGCIWCCSYYSLDGTIKDYFVGETAINSIRYAS